jgi:hypothetical protein
MKSFLRAALRLPWLAVLAAATLAGCGGSGGPAAVAPGESRTQADTGTLLVTMTDADGGFVGYTVDVLSITLQRRGGGTVEVLPATTRVDFAQLTELADLLAVATLAPGDFVAGTIRLDYTNAEVLVESGGEVVQAAVVGPDGAPLGVVELDIELANRSHLVITRGRTALLAVDFDLAASHEVNLAVSPPVVTARPYVVAEVEPVAEKELRLRGALVATDVAAGTYTIDVRPWFFGGGPYGRVTVHTTATTQFEIDGAAATGAEGLAALAAKPAGTMTVAFGTLTRADHRFTAETVHAGDSVGGERLDAVHGTIVARTGYRLTVKGAFAVRRDRLARVLRTVVVDVGPDTKVLQTGAPRTVLGAGALSIGQEIVAFGNLEPAASPAEPPTLDATSGRVRMLPTSLHGTINAVVPGQLNMSLRAIGRLGIAAFDFTGTGATPAQDADPANYEIATGTLGLANLVPGESARVIGFVAPFGAAPPDFEARTIVDHRGLPALIAVGWGRQGTAAPFSGINSSGLVLDIANLGAYHVLIAGARRIDLTTLPVAPTLAPPAAGRALYGVSVGGEIRLFTDFAEFGSTVATLLGGGHAAVALTASGSYEPASATLQARHIALHLKKND